MRELTARNDALEAGSRLANECVAGQPSGQEQLVPASAGGFSAWRRAWLKCSGACEASNAEGERQHSDLREAQSPELTERSIDQILAGVGTRASAAAELVTQEPPLRSEMSPSPGLETELQDLRRWS